jgi:glucose/arabinose dehydrogenase
MKRVGLAVALLLSLMGTTSALASSGPLHLQLIEQAGDITEPTSLVSDPSDPNRLYLTQRDGNIYTLENGQKNLLVDLSSLIAPIGEEEGHKTGEEALNSMVLAPDFAQTGNFYVDFPSKAEPENIQVDELTTGGNPAAVLASLRLVFEIPHPETHHHFGGDLQFGLDRDLYISTGDGYPESSSYPSSSPAQDLGSLLGKILRIDPNDPDGVGPLTYSVPTDNPFVGMPGDKPEIWSYGFRNPFRFSIDSQTGDMFIGDVGEATAEEIDYAQGPVGGAGNDYGWPCVEGSEPLSMPEPGCPTSPPPPTFTAPILTYPHPSSSPHCAAVIGGYVVHDSSLGDLNGRYVYGDFCSGAISSLDPSSPVSTNRLEPALTNGLGTTEGERFFQLDGFGRDACGRVYVLAANVYRIEGDTPASCGLLHVAVSGAGSVTGPEIDCPGSCTRLFTATDPLDGATFTPAAAPGWRFVGWQGDCTGSGSCVPQVDQDRNITAVFAQLTSTSVNCSPSGVIVLQASACTATSGAFRLGRFKADKHKGRGSLAISVPGPGTVVLSAKGIAKVRKRVGGGHVRLMVIPTRRKRKVLARAGRVKVTVKVTFIPGEGHPQTQSRTVTLVKKR